ncbi:phage antirepressor KilAC domain-containing protein [Streptomyces sp. NPDC059979]|uniref:phage antirepressor KilAC domain-containing protein n=1 Tax=Streptomyces sp. NPDC059979 TaxID=3347021 RepID=UPI003683BA13
MSMMPDPDRPVRLVATLSPSPFDGLRQVRPDGSSYWSARDLMPFLGYSRWDNFLEAVDQARAVINAEQGDIAAASQIADSTKIIANARGQKRTVSDLALSRHAAYVTAMRADSRKPEIRAALVYFAVRTRQAEVWEAEEAAPFRDEAVRPAPGSAAVVLPRSYEEALAALLDTVRGRREAEERVAELAPGARSWELMTSEERAGDFSLRQAAHLLHRAGLDTGQNRLLADMRRWRWVMRNGDPYQRTVDRGWLVERVLPYEHRGTGEPRLGTQTRVTAAGVNAAHDLLVRERQVPLPRFPGRGGPRPLAGNPDLGDGQDGAVERGVQW